MPPEKEQIEFLRREIQRLQKELAAMSQKATDAYKRADKAEKQAGKAQQLADKAEKRADKAEKRADKAEKRADKAEQLADEVQQQAAEDKKHSTAYKFLLHTMIVQKKELLIECINALAKINPDIPEVKADQFDWLLHRLNLDIREMTEDNRVAMILVSSFFQHGPEKFANIYKAAEKITPLSVIQANEEAEKPLISSIEEQEKKTRTIMGPVTEAAVKACELHPQDQVLGAAAQIAKSEKPRMEKTKATLAANAKKTAGRQKVKSKDEGCLRLESAYTPEGLCPGCGKVHKRTFLKTTPDFLRVLMSAIDDLLKEADCSCPVVCCENCGTVYAARPEQMPIPYSHASSCTTSAQLVIDFGNMIANGVPLNRIDEIYGVDKLPQLATENFSRPVITWSTDGLGGLIVNKIKAEARKARYIGVDETPFEVLDKEDSGAAHLMVCCSVPNAETAFAVYEYMSSRSGECIYGILKDWEFLHINRDGYQGYETAFKMDAMAQRKITSQVCLVHARRKFCQAVNLDWFEDIENKPDAVEIATKMLEKHTPQYLVYLILQAMSRLYMYEKEGRRRSTESRGQHLARLKKIRQQDSRKMMDCIDNIVDDLAKNHARANGARWVAQTNGNLIDKAVVFWLNNREDLRHFLDDPTLSPDSNNVERNIRAVTVYRKAACFKKSVKGMQSYCNLLTLKETAMLNGIKQPGKWMLQFHRALYEHIERVVWTSRYKGLAQGQGLSLGIQKIEPYMIETFDWDKWLPWNYARELPASDRCDPS